MQQQQEECNSEMEIRVKCKYNYAVSFSAQPLPSIGGVVRGERLEMLCLCLVVCL